ncbi:hypothetical protein C2E23DRAFT_880316 [Lenzites betulinus]|nr:hypothetical protein C2E23DRAFT_880316 [Lenzites betulinus]
MERLYNPQDDRHLSSSLINRRIFNHSLYYINLYEGRHDLSVTCSIIMKFSIVVLCASALAVSVSSHPISRSDVSSDLISQAGVVAGVNPDGTDSYDGIIGADGKLALKPKDDSSQGTSSSLPGPYLHDPFTTIMPSDPPSPARPQRPTAQRTQTPPRSALTPAQAIAQAWMRESSESKKKWRAADAHARDRYTDPVRPWNAGAGSPERKAKGKL